MAKEQLYEPYNIDVKRLSEYIPAKRETAFFELIYIIEGTGQQMINNSKLEYHAGCMFLVTPKDTHCFNIDTTTEFFFLRFNNILLESKGMR